MLNIKRRLTLNRAGVTLVEQVIAMVLLAMAIGAIFLALMMSRSSQEQARQRIQALNLARQGLETLLDRSTTAYEDLARGDTSTDPDWLVQTEAGVVMDPQTGVTATRETFIEPIMSGPDELYLKARVEIDWQLNKLGAGNVNSQEVMEMLIAR